MANNKNLVVLAAALLFGNLVCTHAVEVSVFNGYDMHAAMTSYEVDTAILHQDVKMSLATCPVPHTPLAPNTAIGRTLLITARDLDGPYPILDCGLMSNRIMLGKASVVTLRHIRLQNCSGTKEVMFFRKDEGATLILDDVIQDRGSFCAPPKLIGEQYSQQERPQNVTGAGPATQQQLRVAEAGTNWCIPGNTEPGVPRLDPPSQPLCNLQALLLQDVVVHKEQGPEDQGSWNMVYRNVVQVRGGAVRVTHSAAACVHASGHHHAAMMQSTCLQHKQKGLRMR
jgi:hypothetical protein